MERSFLEENFVQVDVYPVRGSKCLWLNDNLYNEPPDSDKAEKFCAEYTALTDKTIEKTFDSKVIEALVERYGGIGTASNGGGARSHLVGSKVVKGSGTNPLTGVSGDKWYRTGSLNAVDGMAELIYSEVAKILLPLGAVNCHGLIALSGMSAFKKSAHSSDGFDACPGVLLVRDWCARPAHLMRNFGFDGNTAQESMISDYARVRNIHRRVGNNGIPYFLAKMSSAMSAASCQFAAARTALFAHGTVTPSNISLDGAWLDLSNSSFLPSCDNYQLAEDHLPSFLLEPQGVINALIEVVHTYCKHNSLSIDAHSLEQNFWQSFNKYCSRYAIRAIGIEAVNDDCFSADLDIIRNYFDGSFAQQKRADHKDWNQKNAVFKGSRLSKVLDLYNGLSSSSYLEETEDLKLVSMSAYRVLLGEYSNIPSVAYSFVNYTIATAIVAIKRARLMEFFYRGRLTAELYWLSDCNSIEQYRSFLKDSINFTRWFYTGIEDHSIVTVFQDEKVNITYELLTGHFKLTRLGSGHMLGNRKLSELISCENSITICGFNFCAYIKDVCDITQRIANSLKVLSIC